MLRKKIGLLSLEVLKPTTSKSRGVRLTIVLQTALWFQCICESAVVLLDRKDSLRCQRSNRLWKSWWPDWTSWRSRTTRDLPFSNASSKFFQGELALAVAANLVVLFGGVKMPFPWHWTQFLAHQIWKHTMQHSWKNLHLLNLTWRYILQLPN